MSSRFCPADPRRSWRFVIVLLLVVASTVSQLQGQMLPLERAANVVELTGAQLEPLLHCDLSKIAAYACSLSGCRVIPFQFDERDASGQWVLDQGSSTNVDDEPGLLDANDVLLFQAADAGDAAMPRALPEASATLEVSIHDPQSNAVRYAYVALVSQPLASQRVSYVSYDPVSDRARGRRVTLGYAEGVPSYLALDDGPNLLDRLKVRASAAFLFGLIHFSRSEADLQTELTGWHAGPIRIIRAQRQRVRLGWGIRSPTFVSYTFFYRDYAELPVAFRLNFPPTYFFSDIHVRIILDFRDLRGWSVQFPELNQALPIDDSMTSAKRRLSAVDTKWVALRGATATLLQGIELSPSLASVRRRLLYHEDSSLSDPPEAVRGELPGLGYELDRWENAPSGLIWLRSTSYALPVEADVAQFVAALRAPLDVTVRPVSQFGGVR